MNLYKEYGVVIDGVCDNWHQVTLIILDWASVKTPKTSLAHHFFFNNFYFVAKKNESIDEEHT